MWVLLLFGFGDANRSGNNYHWIVCYSQFPEGESTSYHTGPHGETPGSVRRQREQEENVGKSRYCGFLGKEWARQGKQA